MSVVGRALVCDCAGELDQSSKAVRARSNRDIVESCKKSSSLARQRAVPENSANGENTMIRKLALMGLILTVGTLAARADYPANPVKIVVPVAAGGAVDVM